MVTKINMLYLQLLDALTNLSELKHTPLQLLTESLAVLKGVLDELKIITKRDSFSSKADEIYFFKTLQPKFYAEKIFCYEIYEIMLNIPSGTKERKTAYLDAEILQLDRFLNKNAFLYHYYRSGAIELDNLLFDDEVSFSSLLVPELIDTEPGYSNYIDCLFAKFIAYERLKEHLTFLINAPEVPANLFSTPITPPKTLIKKDHPKTMFNLSVDQLGMGARAALDSALVNGKSFQTICEELAPLAGTINKDMISPASLRSNAYTGEDIDKITLIRYLEKMIRLIKEY